MRWVTDPGHGWLQVSFAELAEVGAAIDDFSGYSYINRKAGLLYLEEDQDAGTFIARHPARNSDFFRVLQSVHLDDGSERNIVRRCPRLAQVRR